MSRSKPSKELLVFELFQNKDITYSTIDSLLKYGFDSNESLLSLDFDVDFPQMPDICLSQKCLLRQLLTDFRKCYNKIKDWSQEKDTNPLINAELEDSSRENKTSFDRKSNEIFFESESIVRSIKERLLQHNLNHMNQIRDNYHSFELSFDPIVDQLRECLIRVEKQKQEKDVILQKQRIELKIKDLEITRLQEERKRLETQLMCEKLKVEKLDYKLKSNKIESISNTGGVVNRSQTKTTDNKNCIKTLDEFKAVYYNNICNNESDCEQQSSGTEDQSPRRQVRTSSMTNFVNFWTEVETESQSKSVANNKNLEQLKTSLFTEYVSKHSAGGQSSVTSDADSSVICIDLDSSSDNTSVNRFRNKSYEQKSSEDEEEEDVNSDEEEEQDTSPDISSEIESIVCEPDIECQTTDPSKTSFKPRNHLKVQNNRIVVNSSEHKSQRQQQLPNSAQNKHQKRCNQMRGQSTNWKQFQCDYQNCRFSFVSSEGLKRHIRSVHTKEKPFKCHFDDCGKCFGRSDALKEHMKRHLGLKLFKCSYSDCDFESVSSNSLKRHIVSIHLKEKHFKCLYENCGKTFGRKDSLKKHMEKQHMFCDTN